MAENINLNFNLWKITVEERSKQRMKLHIKLDQEQAVAFRNFCGVFKPGNVSDEQFVKSLFMLGCTAMNQHVTKLVEDHLKDNPTDASGLTVLDLEDEKSNEVSIDPTDQRKSD